ncbi:hypothetical protein [Bradyrhizobium sp. AZCC 2289]|uniref:hypothetical protein n=1 Tax=Bradyrhizobium sp. AZCC 2289 TaxID=3117026 RepID=UPI002FEEFA8A
MSKESRINYQLLKGIVRYVLLTISFPLTIGIGAFYLLASVVLSGASNRMSAFLALMYCLGFFVFSIVNSIAPQPNWAQATGLVGLLGIFVLMLMQ